MKKIELFANYVLRELLPSDIKQMMPVNVSGTKQNTMMVSFETAGERDGFASICRRFEFSYRYVQ